MSKVSRILACIYKPLGWFPVVLINAIAVWSYFAYVVILCFDTITNPVERALYLVFYQPFFFMFMFAYWKTIFSNPGIIPNQYFLSAEDSDRYENTSNPQEVVNELAKELPIVTTGLNNAARFCEQCRMIKPDRAHHCSMCGRCILKMDHHCPWVNNCVGWGNYKYFLLFLSYAILYTMYVALTSLKYFIRYWSFASRSKGTSGLHILFLFFVAAMFSVSLWSLFGFHLFLLSKNRTTLESFRGAIFQHGPDKDGFNLGKMNNFRQVFGNRKWRWFLPIFSTLGNGYVYLTSASISSETTGLLAVADEEEDSLTLPNDQPAFINTQQTSTTNTTSAFVNGDINLNIHQLQSDDDQDDVEFDASNYRKDRHVTVNMTAAY